jgi:hypothetical protein
MKVILTAFQGKLSSEPMEWPEGQGLQIELCMDMDKVQSLRTDEDSVMGIFTASGRHFVLEGGETAEEYRLVEIVGK